MRQQRELVEAIEALQQQSKGQLDELSQMIQLYQTMNGDNPQKISLERYVLQWYLAEVLQSANQQLNQLTKGRYRFELKQETGRSKGNTGLRSTYMMTMPVRPAVPIHCQAVKALLLHFLWH